MRFVAAVIACVVSLSSFACEPPRGAAGPEGGEEIVPQQSQTIPAQKAWELKFQVNVPGEILVQWEIEPGKSVNYLVLTEEQEQRAQAGTPPTQPGRDFVNMTMGVAGNGKDVQKVQPGIYYVVFENAGSADATVKASISGHRT